MRMGPERRPSWRWLVIAEVQALRTAITSHTSTEYL